MAGKVDIANLALTDIGAARIASFSDGSTEANHIDALWDSIREEVLAEHNWDFAKKTSILAQESDEHKRVLMLEQMRVRYPNDVEVLELLADLYLQREEPLKAQSIAEHLKLLQRRGKAGGPDAEMLERRVQEQIKIHDWKRSVIEHFDPEASLDSLRSASHMLTDAPLEPTAPNYTELKDWFEIQS